VVASNTTSMAFGKDLINNEPKSLMVGDSTSVIRILAQTPNAPVEGDFWYDKSTHTLKFYNGTTVKTVQTV